MKAARMASSLIHASACADAEAGACATPAQANPRRMPPRMLARIASRRPAKPLAKPLARPPARAKRGVNLATGVTSYARLRLDTASFAVRRRGLGNAALWPMQDGHGHEQRGRLKARPRRFAWARWTPRLGKEHYELSHRRRRRHGQRG